MKVRRAHIGDLNHLVPLFEEYRHFYHMPADTAMAYIFLQERMVKLESVIFIAEEGNSHAVGFAQLYPLFSSTRMQRLWLLNDLFVKAPHRHSGIATALIDACKKLTVDTHAVALMLETAKTNVHANQLYARTNFLLDNDHNYYYWSVQQV